MEVSKVIDFNRKYINIFIYFSWICVLIIEVLLGVRELENIRNSATVFRTILQRCIAAYKICKYTVQFLLPMKLLETWILRIVWPDVNERVTACLALGHYVRCWAVSLRNSGSSDVYFEICADLIKIKNL